MPLTEADRALLDAVDDLTAVRGRAAVREHAGEDDLAAAALITLIDAQSLLRQCADRIRQLSS